MFLDRTMLLLLQMTATTIQNLRQKGNIPGVRQQPQIVFPKLLQHPLLVLMKVGQATELLFTLVLIQTMAAPCNSIYLITVRTEEIL